MNITFIGHGYVGLVTAAVFADLGNTVYVIGHTASKIEKLKRGILPIYEPGLEELVKRNLENGRLIFTLDYTPSVQLSDVVFIAVGTPSKGNGEADLSTVFEVVLKTSQDLSKYTVVAIKSTVPVGTNRKIKEMISKNKPVGTTFDIASIPEFLREGSAISDTLQPDRIVIGYESERARDLLVELHKPIKSELVLTNLETAEMIKYAANSFLATKISFANAIAKLSELSGADALKVLEGIGLDHRIGKQFLQPGAGYGGSCFPKDVKALLSIAKGLGYDFRLLAEVEAINREASGDIILKASKLTGGLKGKTIAILGLAFKPDTDDMRDAPSISIIEDLLKKGARVRGYDPVASDNAKRILGSKIEYAVSVVSCVKDADLVILVTEWNEFKELDLSQLAKLMKKAALVDARNVYEPRAAVEAGFSYVGVGR